MKSQESNLALTQHTLETAQADAASRRQDGKLTVADAQRKLAQVDKKIAECTVTTPVGGLMVVQVNEDNWPERRPYRLGDALTSGESPVRVFDPAKMQVRCQIGEMDILRVRQGQRAWVTAPTEPDRRYRGTVSLVEELAQSSDVWHGGSPGKKVFGVLVSLEETDPAHLRPGMTVDLEIELGSVRQATMVPLRAIFPEGNRTVLYRAQGEGFTAVPITVGSRNDLLVEVKGDLKAGDQVALARPPRPPAGREVKR